MSEKAENVTIKDVVRNGKNVSVVEREIPLPEKTYKTLKKKAKAEGKTPDQKAAEIVMEKAKPQSPFPADAEINDYGFLHFRKAWLEDLGWKNGMALKVEKNADGTITLKKP